MSDGPALLRARGGNLSPNPKVTLRRLVAPTITVVLLLMAAVVPSIMASGGRPDVAVLPPDEEDAIREEERLYELDPTINVVDHEPNNACSGAHSWPLLSTGLTKGKLTKDDLQDWSSVFLLRTESLAASASKGVVLLESAPDCGTPTTAAQLDAETNAWMPLRISFPSDPESFEGYHLEYKVSANDAGTGGDLWHEPGPTFTVNAMPESVDPRERISYPGSLPNRGDEPLGPDIDWFRVTTGLAQNPDGQGESLNLGLLNVYFSPDCYTGQTSFTLVQSDGSTPISLTETACGPVLKSCIAASFSVVYAKLEADRQTRTLASYDFAAEVSPLALVSLEDGVEVTSIDQPWCDPVTPTVLAAAAGASGEPWGVMDKHGRVVARVNTGSP